MPSKLVISLALGCSLNGLEASFQQMKRDYAASFDRLVRQLMVVNDGPEARRISDILSADNLERINEYGCWCYFQDDHGRGHGRPVNQMDRFCKDLHDGYECAILDTITETGNDTCVPYDVTYVTGTGGGEANLVLNCETFNADLCASRACQVEGLFVVK